MLTRSLCRPYMEDRLFCAVEENGTRCYAVFDGHGGAEASAFCLSAKRISSALECLLLPFDCSTVDSSPALSYPSCPGCGIRCSGPLAQHKESASLRVRRPGQCFLGDINGKRPICLKHLDVCSNLLLIPGVSCNTHGDARAAALLAAPVSRS